MRRLVSMFRAPKIMQVGARSSTRPFAITEIMTGSKSIVRRHLWSASAFNKDNNARLARCRTSEQIRTFMLAKSKKKKKRKRFQNKQTKHATTTEEKKVELFSKTFKKFNMLVHPDRFSSYPEQQVYGLSRFVFCTVITPIMRLQSDLTECKHGFLVASQWSSLGS